VDVATREELIPQQLLADPMGDELQRHVTRVSQLPAATQFSYFITRVFGAYTEGKVGL
jgi:hypothetical protein